MQRLTQKRPDGRYDTAATPEQLAGRLGRWEDLLDFLERRVEENAAALQRLKREDKTKTARYRELLGQKLMDGQLMQMIGLFVGEDGKNDGAAAGR